MSTSQLLQAAEFVRQGDLQQAEPLLAEFHRQYPQNVDCLNYLSFVTAKLGKAEDAVTYAKKAVEIDSRNPNLLANLSLILIHQKLWAEGEAFARKALEIDSRHKAAADFLGRALLNQNKPAEALIWFRTADEESAKETELEFRMGTCLLMLGKLEKAGKCFRNAIELYEPYPDAWNNLGITLRYMGRYQEALQCYERALQIKPDYADAHLNRATIWLSFGNFEQGWMEFEWRFVTHALLREKFTQPLWDGSSFNGKTLLIHAEQGFGDTIQLARYMPLVKERGGTVCLECQPELQRWLEKHPGIDVLVPKNSQRPDFDLQIPIFSLPRVFQTNLQTIPPVINPFSSAKETQKSDEIKIGIAWAGRKHHADDQVRSCELENFLPLCEIPKVRLYSLQKDFAGALPEKISNAADECRDFYDTAQVIEGLDLVIAVDTAPAHLAATMGKPTWLLTAIPSDWRWMHERDDSPWYPSVKIFRQKTRGDWREVFKRILTELTK